MDNKEKMLAGELYTPDCPELAPVHLRCDQLCQQYNMTDPADKAASRKILEELLPYINDDTVLERPIQFDYGRFTKFGKRVFVNYNFICMDTAWINIGDDVLIGPNCTIAAPLHPMNAEARRYKADADGKLSCMELSKPVTIEHDCWICSNVVLCAGVTVGAGSVIGAGSVVTRDIPAGVFAAGNPCRVIKELSEGQSAGSADQ